MNNFLVTYSRLMNSAAAKASQNATCEQELEENLRHVQEEAKRNSTKNLSESSRRLAAEMNYIKALFN